MQVDTRYIHHAYETRIADGDFLQVDGKAYLQFAGSKISKNIYRFDVNVTFEL